MNDSNITVKISYEVGVMREVEYWFENGRIHSSAGTSIGYDNGPMTEKEAKELASLGRIVLGIKP